VFRHGLPEDPVVWTLEEDKTASNPTHEARQGDEFGGPKIIDCTQCGVIREGGKASYADTEENVGMAGISEMQLLMIAAHRRRRR
jgi:hypothetical protein